MGVYIKGMDMPKKGCIKMLVLLCDGKVIETTTGCQPQPEEQNYKAVPVPEHGRLIEESKVLDIVFAWCPDDDGSVSKYGDLREMLDEIETLPTIIPADPAEEGE